MILHIETIYSSKQILTSQGAFEYEGIRAGQEKKEFWFNLIATGVVVGLAIVCPPAGLAAGVIYTAIDVGGAVKGEDLISGRKLSDEERLMRGAFAIVPGAGGLAAKSLLKHMPALATVMKTASKTVDDAIKPIKNTVDHIALSGKQSVKTAITKTQQKVSTIAVNSVKSVQKSVEPVINEAKQRTAIKVASTKSAFSTKVENAIKLGKAHVEQLKLAVAHPIPAAVTSKTGQSVIRGTASIIDNVKRPVYIKSMEVIGGPKIPVGIERGPSKDVFKNKGEDIISRMQVEKDALRGTKGTGNREAEVPPAFRQTEFASSYEARLNQTPALENPKVEFEGERGESKCILKPPPDHQLKQILDEVGIEGIQYKNAVPDFSPTAKAQVEINYMLGGKGTYGGKARRANFVQSDQKLADQINGSPELAVGMEPGIISARDIKKYREINKLTWHELNDVKTMQLVPTKINSEFGHLGGVGEINAGAFKSGGFANKQKEEILK